MLATAVSLCFPQILNLKEEMTGYTNSCFTVLLWLLCFCVLRQQLGKSELWDRRGLLLSALWSVLFTAALLFGKRLDQDQNVNVKEISLWISLPVLSCFFTVLVRSAWSVLDKLCIGEKVSAAQTRMLFGGQLGERRREVLSFLCIFFCWFLVFLAVYPGFFVYDAQEEYLQVATRSFHTHHPLLHVLLLGGAICGVHKLTGSYNLGIACYTLFQMAILSGVFAWLLSYLRRKGLPRWFRIISMLYFALCPVVVMFSLCSAKDALFTAALLVFLIMLLELGGQTEHFFASAGVQGAFVCSAALMMLFRKNGVYAYVVMVPLLMFFLHRKIKGKRMLRLGVLLGTALAVFLLGNGLLTQALHAQSGENQEILTVPIQQLARTYKYTPEVFTDEEKQLLYRVLPKEVLAGYNPKLSDPVKYYFNNQEYEKDRSQYALLWLKIGLRKPLSYLNAWMMTSYGFWYPDTVIDVYAGNSVFTFTYGECSYFGYEVEEPGVRDSKLPWLDEVYRKLSLELYQEKLPVISMLFSPGFMFWCFLFSLCYALHCGRVSHLPAYLMVLLLWLTLVLGPTYLPRYVLIFWYALPLLAAELSGAYTGGNQVSDTAAGADF